MSTIEQTYELIIAYLKGVLSNRQRHDLEKKMMQDTFDEEAFEGLSQMSANELETDLDALTDRLQGRINQAKKRNLMPVFRIAAALVVLMGVAGILYVILRTPSQDLITQDIPKKQKTPQESVSPPLPKPTENITSEYGLSTSPPEKSTVETTKHPILAENLQESQEKAEAEPEVQIEGVRKAEEPQMPVLLQQKAAQALPQTLPAQQSDVKYIIGKVVGIDGEALPGVTIVEKGTSHGTITDLDGNFSIQVGDPGSELLLSYAGYQPLDLNARDISGKPITLQEDMLALEEVVVVGYGTQKKSNETGAVSRMEAEDAAPGGAIDSYGFVNPVPPGGTLKAFKNWVNERIDSATFKPFPGKYRVQAILTVQYDGRIGDIRIRSTAPSPIVDEYRKALTQSPLWKPALKDEEPVDAEVVIRFVIVVE
jgi:hypothetical protein